MQLLARTFLSVAPQDVWSFGIYTQLLQLLQFFVILQFWQLLQLLIILQFLATLADLSTLQQQRSSNNAQAWLFSSLSNFAAFKQLLHFSNLFKPCLITRVSSKPCSISSKFSPCPFQSNSELFRYYNSCKIL